MTTYWEPLVRPALKRRIVQAVTGAVAEKVGALVEHVKRVALHILCEDCVKSNDDQTQHTSAAAAEKALDVHRYQVVGVEGLEKLGRPLCPLV